MENALSRRNFIGGALIAGAGMVGAAALSGCAGKAYAKQDTTGIKWDKEADVVIVGGGAAGLWAAVQAYDNNLSAIVLESSPRSRPAAMCAAAAVICSPYRLIPTC